MANVRLVEVAKCIEGLLHDHGCLRLSEELLLGNMVKELTTLADPRYSRLGLRK